MTAYRIRLRDLETDEVLGEWTLDDDPHSTDRTRAAVALQRRRRHK